MKRTLFKHILLAALRDKLVLSLFLVFAVVTALSVFLGGAAVIEKDQFSIVFAAFALRCTGIAGLTFFIITFIRRSFEGKDIDFLLSRPMSRPVFLLSYSAAFAFIALCMGVLQGVMLSLVAPHLLGAGHALWALSIIAENIIMALVALFFALTLTSAVTAAMVCLGFYVLARMMGQILGIIDTAPSFFAAESLTFIMHSISIIMPRLDLMGQSAWLIYGPDQAGIDVPFVVLQLFTFGGLIFMASLIDLMRKNF